MILPVSLNLWHHAKCTAASAKLRQPFWKTSGWISTAKSNYRNPSRFPFVDSYWFNIHIQPFMTFQIVFRLECMIGFLQTWLVRFVRYWLYLWYVCLFFFNSYTLKPFAGLHRRSRSACSPFEQRGWAEEHQPRNGEFIWDYIRVV